MTRNTPPIFPTAVLLLCMAAASADGQEVGLTLLGSPANGDTATVEVVINLDSAEAVRLLGRVERSVAWLSGTTANEITGFTGAAEIQWTTWTPGVRIYHTDQIIVDALNAEFTVVASGTLTVAIPIPPVTVAHDGYLASFYSQQQLERAPMLLDGGFAELATDYDVGIFGTSLMFDGRAEGDATENGYGYVDRLRAINPDFIPIAYHYWAFYAPNWATFPVPTPQRQQHDLMVNYVLNDPAGNPVAAVNRKGHVFAIRTNPTLIDTTGTREDALASAYWNVTARLLRDIWNHSSSRRDQVGFMMDWMNGHGYPQMEGVTHTDIDLDGDGISYAEDAEHAGWLWLTGQSLDEAGAWIAACDSFKVAMRRYLPAALSLVNGGYGDDFDLARVAGVDGHLWEFYRHAAGAGAPQTWKLFREFVHAYPGIWAVDGVWTGPYNLGIWDTRHEATEFPALQGVKQRTEGPALIAGSPAGWSVFADNKLPDRERLRAASGLDATAAAMNLGPPTAPAVFDSLFHCYRMYGDHKVSLRWNGDRRYPNGVGWKIVDTVADTVVRNHEYDTVPSFAAADLVFARYTRFNFDKYPFGGEAPDFYDLPVLGYESSTILRGTAQDQSDHDNPTLVTHSFATNAGDSLTSRAWVSILYLGLDLLEGARIQNATLNMRYAWGNTGVNFRTGETFHIIGATGVGYNRWRIDDTHTTWDAPSPGYAWPRDMGASTVAEIKGENGAVITLTKADLPDSVTRQGDWFAWPITEIVQVAADYPADWAGIWLVYEAATGGRVFNFESTKQGIRKAPYIEVKTSRDTTSPSRVSDLDYSVGVADQIVLTWTAATDNVGLRAANPYGVYKNTDGTPHYRFVGWTQTNSYTDTDVVAGMTYHYVVVVFDEAGNFSTDSNRVSVKGR